MCQTIAWAYIQLASEMAYIVCLVGSQILLQQSRYLYQRHTVNDMHSKQLSIESCEV